jgi:hypothetical protein
MPKASKQVKKRPETYEKPLTLHPLTVEEALKLALVNKPPKKKDHPV